MTQVCSICLFNYTGFGNNAYPVNSGRCCDPCNWKHVVPARLRALGFGITQVDVDNLRKTIAGMSVRMECERLVEDAARVYNWEVVPT